MNECADCDRMDCRERGCIALVKRDILDDLDIKYLPQIQGYNGEYTDEDFVFETFKAAAEEIRRLRALVDAKGE